MAASKNAAQADIGFSVAQIQGIPLLADDRKLQKVITEMLALLSFRQPMSGKDMRSFLGISKKSLHTSVKRLCKVGVLIKVKFEHHQLYVINGEHTPLVRSCLNS